MPRPPNILWVVTTQWRAQAAGYAGDLNARTPHIDKFAGESHNFRHAVTPHPFGPFARAALLTGIPSPANGVREYFDSLPANVPTIANEMAQREYHTAFFGKWHLAMRDRTAPLVGDPHARMIVPPENRGGFEFWEGFESGFLLNDPWLHGTRLPTPARFEGYQSDVVCERAGGWLRGRSADQPWFCVVSLEPPHPPYSAPAAGIAPRDPNSLALDPNVPRGGEVERVARADLGGYYAHIEATDRAIGRLLNSLEREETIVVFTSVHGDMHGANGLFRKGWPHEESIRVPLLVRMPPSAEDTTSSRRRDELVSLLDLARWTVGWAEGNEWIVPDFAAQQISMPTVVALPQQCDRAWRGVRTRTRKLVVADTTSEKGDPRSGVWLYFDLERDPGEHTNLATDPGRQREIAGLESLVQTPPPIG
jgi:arylsulfatase A-like enzyme